MLRRGVLFLGVIFLANSGLLFAVQETHLELEPIVIAKPKSHLLNSYSIESEKLKDFSFFSPVEALGGLPLDLQSRSLKSGIQTDFSLRGSTFQGVLMLIDGQRINDPQTAHHNSDIPFTLEDIERIEVTPGISSHPYGPDSIGGAVNFILKKPEEKKRVLEASLGQHQMKSGLLSISEKIDNLGVRLSVESQESSGFYEDTDFKKFTSSFTSRLDMPCGEFNLNFGYQEKEFGAYDFYTPGLSYPSKEWTKTYLLDAGLNMDKDGFMIKPNFLWRRHYDKFALDKNFVRSQLLNHHRTDMYTPNIYFQKETEILGRIGLGLEYGEERINSTNLGKYNRKHKSIFLDNSQDLTSKFSVGTSFRFDDFDDFDEVYTGSANLRFRVFQQDSLHLGASRSMRIPSFTELYYNDQTTQGNPDLSAEESLNYQIGYDYEKQGLNFGLTLFLRQEEDMIDWVKRSLEDKWKSENFTKVEVKGIESYLKLNINQDLILDSNYTYIDKRIDDQGYLYKYGPNYIRHLINTTLVFNLPFGRQSIGLTYKKKPNRDGWLLVNLQLIFTPTRKSRLFLDITNLLNTEYQEIEGIPQPGRWLQAGFRLEW